MKTLLARCCFIFLLSGGWFSFQAVAQDDNEPIDAFEWIERLRYVANQTNFQASFVLYRAGQETLPYLWRHGILEDGTRMEQLNLQNGPGREYIRVNGEVSVFEPDVPPYTVQSHTINGPIPGALLNNQESLYQAYEFVLIGRARVSGRPAQQIRVVSRDNTRYSYQLWLDEQTGMLLKFNMLGKKGNVLEQIQMSSFRITEKPHEYFSRVDRSKLPGLMALPDGSKESHQWQITFVPEGMFEVRHDSRNLSISGHQVEYRLYTDGLIDVSIYVEPAELSLNTDVVLRHKLSTFLSRTDGDIQVTVIGEIPPETADAMARSLRKAGP